MITKKLNVQLFGTCSIGCGETIIQDNSKRASKLWLLIAFLICNGGRNLSQEELIEQLWGNETNTNPASTLKTTLWRTRTLLDELWPSAGHELIQNRNNGYEWNMDIPMEVDVHLFEQHCRIAAAAEDQDVRMQELLMAVSIYKSDFLEKYSAEDWVSPLTAYYNNLYINAVLEICMLASCEKHAHVIVEIVRPALRVSPYHEELYAYLMQALIHMQEFKQAEDVYEELREMLLANLGVTPNENIQALYEEVKQHMRSRTLTAEMLKEQLQEKNPEPGPLFCDFSVFKHFYQAEARSVSRRGDAVHVGLLSAVSADGKELSDNTMELAMMRLREQLCSGLRRGDVVSRCSATQYVVLLLQANFENSNKVCDRIVRAFMQAHYRNPVNIISTVLPVEPLGASPRPQPIKKNEWKKV